MSSANRAQTKIVATVGPACRQPDQLTELIKAGADVFRVNMAHGTRVEHEETLGHIRAVSSKLDRPIAVLIDLAGPKLRLGELAGGQVECRADSVIRLVRGATTNAPDTLVSTYDKMVDELDPGDRVLLVDGTVSLVVLEKSADEVRLRVTQPGTVGNRQGINLPGVKLSLPAMSDVDRDNAIWAARVGIDYVSLSFVRKPDEVLDLKALLRAHGSSAKVVAKIEKPEALTVLEEVVSAADAVMVARGDLGVEMDVAEMPVIQKRIIGVCNRLQKPVIVATQMLDSMQRSNHPTRAEVTDVANAILDGCDACMLSGETAAGLYPRAAVEMMNRVALKTEELLKGRPHLEAPTVLPTDLKPITQAVVYGAGHLAQQIKASLLVVASHSGATALAVSKQRSVIPIVGISDQDQTLRQMCLFWGVIPLRGLPTESSAQLLAEVEKWGLNRGLISRGDFLVLVAGGVTSGSIGHNMIRVYNVKGLA